MLIEAKGLKIFRLLPEDVERLLLAKFGDKLVAVNVSKLEKQNRTRTRSAAYYQRKDSEKT